jgi:hypothetical protein
MNGLGEDYYCPRCGMDKAKEGEAPSGQKCVTVFGYGRLGCRTSAELAKRGQWPSEKSSGPNARPR